MFRSRIFQLYDYEDVTIAGEGLLKFGLCSTLRALEQGGIFIEPHLLLLRALVFLVSSGKTAPFSRLYMLRIYSNLGLHGSVLTRDVEQYTNFNDIINFIYSYIGLKRM
jgi:hypothetical protein